MLSATERQLRGRIGAYKMHATHDVHITSAPGRAAFESSFLRDVDPEGVLPLEERERRAQHLRRAHFTKLAFLSARARSAGRGCTTAGDQPAAVLEEIDADDIDVLAQTG